MTQEQQRIAIAEACGFINARMWGESCIASMGITSEGKYWGSLGVPDYLNDLNAMHEAEKILPQWVDGSYKGTRYHYILELGMIESPVWATAAQRAEAFLRTINKWTKNQTKPNQTNVHPHPNQSQRIKN